MTEVWGTQMWTHLQLKLPLVDLDQTLGCSAYNPSALRQVPNLYEPRSSSFKN